MNAIQFVKREKNSKSLFINDFTQWSRNLTTDEKNMIYLYSYNLYQPINVYMRTGVLGEHHKKEALDKNILTLFGALKKATVQREYTVYRGIDAEEVKRIFQVNTNFSREEIMRDLFSRKSFGVMYREQAFLSTSLEGSVADWFSLQGCQREKISFVIKIHVPKGIHGAYIQNLTKRREQEFLIAPNQIMIFDAVNRVDLFQNIRIELKARLVMNAQQDHHPQCMLRNRKASRSYYTL